MPAKIAKYADYDLAERIHGVEYQMFPAKIRHAEIRSNLEKIFHRYLKGKRCKTFSEVGVFLDDNLLIPDVLIVCDRDKIKYDGIHGAPDLVVEILSPSTSKRDKSSKLKLYEQYGVREYWIVDPKGNSIEVRKLQDSEFVLDEVYHLLDQEEWDCMDEDERKAAKISLKVSLYDDLEIPLKDIFAE